MKKFFKWTGMIIFFPITLTVLTIKKMVLFNKLHPNYKKGDVLSKEANKASQQGLVLLIAAILSWVLVFTIPSTPVLENEIVEKEVVVDTTSKKYSGLTLEQEQLFDETLSQKINGEVDLKKINVDFQIFEDGSGLGGTYSYSFTNSRGLIENKLGLLMFNTEMTELISNELNTLSYGIDSSLESTLKTTSKELIERTLKSPSSAKFPGFLDDGWKFYIDENQNITIKTYVDAQNSFGAMIRTNYELFADLDANTITIISAK